MMAGKRRERKGMVVDLELRREAARIFPKLANGEGYLKMLSTNSDKTAPVFGVFIRRNNYRRCVLCVEQNVVEGLKNWGWLNQVEERIELSDDGLLWLRRHLAGGGAFS